MVTSIVLIVALTVGIGLMVESVLGAGLQGGTRLGPVPSVRPLCPAFKLSPSCCSHMTTIPTDAFSAFEYRIGASYMTYVLSATWSFLVAHYSVEL